MANYQINGILNIPTVTVYSRDEHACYELEFSTSDNRALAKSIFFNFFFKAIFFRFFQNEFFSHFYAKKHFPDSFISWFSLFGIRNCENRILESCSIFDAQKQHSFVFYFTYEEKTYSSCIRRFLQNWIKEVEPSKMKLVQNKISDNFHFGRIFIYPQKNRFSNLHIWRPIEIWILAIFYRFSLV